MGGSEMCRRGGMKRKDEDEDEDEEEEDWHGDEEER